MCLLLPTSVFQHIRVVSSLVHAINATWLNVKQFKPFEMYSYINCFDQRNWRINIQIRFKAGIAAGIAVVARWFKKAGARI